jgi:hypothetical protein
MIEDNQLDDGSNNPISAVWRQARVLLDTKAQRAKVRGKVLSIRTSSRPRQRSVRAPTEAASQVIPTQPFRFLKAGAALAAVLVLALLIRALWGASVH